MDVCTEKNISFGFALNESNKTDNGQVFHLRKCLIEIRLLMKWTGDVWQRRDDLCYSKV